VLIFSARTATTATSSILHNHQAAASGADKRTSTFLSADVGESVLQAFSNIEV
jgi:hypothetical protein